MEQHFYMVRLNQGLSEIKARHGAFSRMKLQMLRQFKSGSLMCVSWFILLSFWSAAGWPFWKWSWAIGLIASLLMGAVLCLAAPVLAPLLNTNILGWREQVLTSWQNETLYPELELQALEPARVSWQRAVILLSVLVLTLALCAGWQANLNGMQDPQLNQMALLLYLALGCFLIVKWAEFGFKLQTAYQWLQQYEPVSLAFAQELETLHQQESASFSYLVEETQAVRALARPLQWKTYGWQLASILISMPLAYIGSLSFAHQSGYGFSYLWGIRFHPLSFGVILLLLIVAKLSLSRAVSESRLMAYSLNQRLQGWQIHERQQGLPYRFLNQQQLDQDRHNIRIWFTIGAAVLCCDMSLNYYYFQTQTSMPWFSALILTTLVPCLVLFLALFSARLETQLALYQAFLNLSSFAGAQSAKQTQHAVILSQTTSRRS